MSHKRPKSSHKYFSDNEEATHTENRLTQISHVSGDAADLNKHGNSNILYKNTKQLFHSDCQEQQDRIK